MHRYAFIMYEKKNFIGFFFNLEKTLYSQRVNTVSNILSTCYNDINASIRVFRHYLEQMMVFKNSFGVDFTNSLPTMNVLLIPIEMSSISKIFTIKAVTYVFTAKECVHSIIRLSLGLSRHVQNLRRSVGCVDTSSWNSKLQFLLELEMLQFFKNPQQ